MSDLAAAIDAALPQTQCTRCGYPDCRRYAEAIAAGEAGIDRCPPGGAQGIARLSSITGRPVVPLNSENGVEGPRRLAVIDEAWCIGCTLCIKACPVDCIVGAPKRMHGVLASLCSGCELCIEPCPVDCIDLVPARRQWSQADALAARTRHAARGKRLAAAAKLRTATTGAFERERAVANALARARARRAVMPPAYDER